MGNRLHCHVDGKPVHLGDDLEATITSAGGYDQLTATVDRSEVRHAHQGSPIAVFTEGGYECWYGRLDATPTVSRFRTVELTATGPVSRLRRQRGPWLEQSREYDLWKPITSDPIARTAVGSMNIAQSITADSQTGRLMWTLPNGTDVKQNDANGQAAWVMGEPVTRIAFDWAVDSGTSNLALRVLTGDGPGGTLTQVGSDYVSGAGTGGTVDLTIGGTKDLVALLYTWTAANTTTASNRWLRVGNLRINGRTTGDDLSPGGVMSDMAARIGLGVKNVRSSGQNALPFYWTGGSWADAFDALATLDDWPWFVARDEVLYDSWQPGWTVHFPEEQEDLTFPPIYNRVRVFYQATNGATRSVLLEASPDPLARWNEDNEFDYDLGDTFPDDVVPNQVASALLDRLSEQRVYGTVTLLHGLFHDTNRVWTPHRRYTAGYFGEEHLRIRPGRLVRLGPYPSLGPQRVVGVRIHANDVQLEIGEDLEDVSVERVLARAAGRQARTRRRLRPRK